MKSSDTRSSGRKTRRILALCLAIMLMLAASPALTAPLPTDVTVTFTLDADFDQGTLLNVNHSPPYNDQLQLNLITTPFPFIWVAASDRGTAIRIDVNTGEILGEYRTAPEGRLLNPSRTTVDLFGNVWTGNRDEFGLIGPTSHGSVVKIGLVIGGTRADGDGTPNPDGDYLAPPFQYNTCSDRDGDDLIKTSRELGDIRPWPDETDGLGGADGTGHGLVEDAEDECILIYQRLPNAPATRHISVDANNNVWIGGYTVIPQVFYKLDDDTGQLLDTFDAPAVGCGGYGGLIDGNGVLWSASVLQDLLLRYDIANDQAACLPINRSYGLGIDTNGFIWNSMYTNNTIAKISPTGVVEPGFPVTTGGATGDRGVAVSPENDHVWVANSYGVNVSRLDNNGALLKVILVGLTPTGVAVDANGKVWVTNRDSNTVMRIDPNGGLDGLGAVDLTVNLGDGAGPYNYSDMTGVVAIGETSPQGAWSVIHDSEINNSSWGVITWNMEPEGSQPPGTDIVVEARADNDASNLGSKPFAQVGNGEPFSLPGRFIEVRATLKANGDGDSPILSDLTMEAGPPTAVELSGFAADWVPAARPASLPLAVLLLTVALALAAAAWPGRRRLRR